MEGIVIKGYSGFYYVRIGKDLWECSLRGRFRLEKQQVLVGDRVVVKQRHGLKGVIDKVLPRRTFLIRPPVANVERAVIIFAAMDPDPNLPLLDRFLLLAAAAGVEPVICFNKADLAKEKVQEMTGLYRKVGYHVFYTSAKQKVGLEDLQSVLNEGISVLAGPSGVGKSSLLNAIAPGLSLKTGEISRKLGRGKHTTRHVELLSLPSGGLVADTPGFSSLYLPKMKREELADFFPEFIKYMNDCRFNGCLHNQEPDCAVKNAVAQGDISEQRYNNYLMFLKEVIEQERRY